ncbi:putative alpha-glucanotransferase [Crocosphaera subtropica ATCC 51142]|uniref:Alpha-glucanotransferase n=1 Tax=Crocosphaera subtropica (strain ATCC 51142 / BH68) TaxID=43989 RepID=B1WRW4_CROS5|nr:alpha-amylase family glycosyl hydrolase [Crocosphaera subtropica]ACB50158.1 putative alpha-glucanotransferase [Crocosphaera subtropica ATCC 51142]
MGSLIEFELFAPYNKGATVKGSFSDWSEIEMEKDEKGYFRTKVELEDGVYEYKFRVQSQSPFLDPDEWVEINDPYAKEVSKECTNSLVRVKDGEKVIDTYSWKNDAHSLSSNNSLVIYELFIDKFSDNFQGVINKLDYLSELGINAIELMPVQAFPDGKKWGYTPCYYFATEPTYGSSEDLKRLIDECHGRGIRVLLDCVFNHSDPDASLTQIDYNYWYRKEPKDPENNWGPEFDYQHYDDHLDIKPAWQFIGDVVKFWVEEYHIDGFRYDAANQIDHYEFLDWLSEQARNASGNKPFFNTAEYIPEDPNLAGYNQPMDSCWHESFYQQAIAHICGDHCNLDQLKEVINCQKQGYQGAISAINYISCHDHQSVFSELGDRNIFEEEAFQRAKLGAILLITSIGVPLIWMGNEFGEYDADAESSINWDLLENDSNQTLLKTYKKLIALKTKNNALHTDNIDFIHEDIDNKILVYHRWNNEDSRVVVVLNFSGNSFSDYKIPNFPNSNHWQDYLNDETYEASDNQLILNIGAYEGKILVS